MASELTSSVRSNCVTECSEGYYSVFQVACHTAVCRTVVMHQAEIGGGLEVFCGRGTIHSPIVLHY